MFQSIEMKRGQQQTSHKEALSSMVVRFKFHAFHENLMQYAGYDRLRERSKPPEINSHPFLSSRQ